MSLTNDHSVMRRMSRRRLFWEAGGGIAGLALWDILNA